MVWSMTAMPPSEGPADHVNLIVVSSVVVRSFVSNTGASGTSCITAPLPYSDMIESPYTLTEIIFA